MSRASIEPRRAPSAPGGASPLAPGPPARGWLSRKVTLGPVVTITSPDGTSFDLNLLEHGAHRALLLQQRQEGKRDIRFWLRPGAHHQVSPGIWLTSALNQRRRLCINAAPDQRWRIQHHQKESK